jgi:hypothetical protein
VAQLRYTDGKKQARKKKAEALFHDHTQQQPDVGLI